MKLRAKHMQKKPLYLLIALSVFLGLFLFLNLSTSHPNSDLNEKSGGAGTYINECTGRITSIKDNPNDGTCLIRLLITDSSNYTEIKNGDEITFEFSYSYSGNDVCAGIETEDNVTVTFAADIQSNGSYPGYKIEKKV